MTDIPFNRSVDAAVFAPTEGFILDQSLTTEITITTWLTAFPTAAFATAVITPSAFPTSLI
jgi:hypothetical protein